jgi:DNA-binding transcriptional regulator YdaS (Cro superfamily)
MSLKTYFADLNAEQREAFAGRCGSTRGVLQNIMYGLRPCAPLLAAAIERESEGKVRRWDLRPTDWHLIWPELAREEGAPVPPPAANAADAREVANG